jgi:hypothetical protein
MRTGRAWVVRVIGMLMCSVVLVGAASCGSATGPAGNHPVLPLKVQFNPDGSIAPLAPLATPDGVSIRLLGVERGPSQYLFHFNITSKISQTQRVLATGADHKFVLAGARPAGTPADQGIIDLAAPGVADIAAHPALAATVEANVASDGWLKADLNALGYPPQLLMYRYATVHTTRFTSPSDRSTCQPADLYQVLEWDM